MQVKFGVEICMIGARLKQERERLGLTQPAFAEAANAKKRTLIDWEKDVSSPTAAQLSSLAVVGVDVLWVVTGQRLQGDATLPSDERLLLTAYRACEQQAKQTLLQTAAMFGAGSSSAVAKTVVKKERVVSTAGGIAAGRDVKLGGSDQGDVDAKSRSGERDRGRT
jgi:transcriptional regulator with XRE-family HTH domain